MRLQSPTAAPQHHQQILQEAPSEKWAPEIARNFAENQSMRMFTICLTQGIINPNQQNGVTKTGQSENWNTNYLLQYMHMMSLWHKIITKGMLKGMTITHKCSRHLQVSWNQRTRKLLTEQHPRMKRDVE